MSTPPATFYWKQSIQRLYLIPVFFTVLPTSSSRSLPHCLLKLCLSSHQFQFQIHLPYPVISPMGLDYGNPGPINTPAFLSCLLMLTLSWLELGEEWRSVFPSPICHLNFGWPVQKGRLIPSLGVKHSIHPCLVPLHISNRSYPFYPFLPLGFNISKFSTSIITSWTILSIIVCIFISDSGH